MSLARRTPQAYQPPQEIETQTEVFRQPTSVQLYGFQDLKDMAIEIAESGLIKGVDTPQKAFTLMLFAQSQNRHPGEIIGRYHIIEGVPVMKADVMLAEFQAGGGRVEWVRSDDQVCEAIFSHATLHPKPFRITFTFKDLVESGVATQWDHKSQKWVIKNVWRKHASQMLRARAVTAGIRAVNPGAVHGIYAPEEIEAPTDPAPLDAPPPTMDAALPAPILATPPPTSARAFAAAPPVATPPAAKPAPDKVKLLTQAETEDYDSRPYHLVVANEVDALNLELKKFNDVTTVNKHQIHRHTLKAAVQAGLIQKIAPGTNVSPAQCLEMCQDLYRDQRDWVRKEIATYLDSIFAQAKSATEASDPAAPENESQEAPEPGSNG